MNIKEILKRFITINPLIYTLVIILLTICLRIVNGDKIAYFIDYQKVSYYDQEAYQFVEDKVFFSGSSYGDYCDYYGSCFSFIDSSLEYYNVQIFLFILFGVSSLFLPLLTLKRFLYNIIGLLTSLTVHGFFVSNNLFYNCQDFCMAVPIFGLPIVLFIIFLGSLLINRFFIKKYLD